MNKPRFWCSAHLRQATHTKDGQPCCDPALGGIMMPCKVTACIQPEYDNMPPEVMAAARTLGNWFHEQGVNTWELLDVCSRNHAAALNSIQQDIQKLGKIYEA